MLISLVILEHEIFQLNFVFAKEPCDTIKLIRKVFYYLIKYLSLYPQIKYFVLNCDLSVVLPIDN